MNQIQHTEVKRFFYNMPSDNPYMAPNTEDDGTPPDPRSKALGCWLTASLSGLVGFCWAGYYAYRNLSEAFQQDVERGRPGPELAALSIPFDAFLGGIIGALAGGIVHAAVAGTLSTRRGGCLIAGVGSVIGFFAGFFVGGLIDDAAREAAIRERSLHIAPSVAPWCALAGTLVGSLAAGLLWGAWARGLARSETKVP